MGYNPYLRYLMTKFKIILFLKRNKKSEPIDKEFTYFLPKKILLSSHKYGFGIRDPEETHPASRCQKSTGTRICFQNTLIPGTLVLAWTRIWLKGWDRTQSPGGRLEMLYHTGCPWHGQGFGLKDETGLRARGRLEMLYRTGCHWHGLSNCHLR